MASIVSHTANLLPKLSTFHWRRIIQAIKTLPKTITKTVLVNTVKLLFTKVIHHSTFTIRN